MGGKPTARPAGELEAGVPPLGGMLAIGGVAARNERGEPVMDWPRLRGAPSSRKTGSVGWGLEMLTGLELLMVVQVERRSDLVGFEVILCAHAYPAQFLRKPLMVSALKCMSVF